MNLSPKIDERNPLESAIVEEAEAAYRAVQARRRVDALIAAMATPSAPVTEPAALLTKAALARRLGISGATVSRLDPPGVCVGDASSRRYDLATVRAWLAEREPKATTPAKREADLDVSDLAAAAGLRAVNGGGR